MKMVTINKIKVRIFEEDDLIQKLKMEEESVGLVLEYQRKFPELLQEESNDFMISTKLLHKQLSVGRDYSTWIKSRITKYSFKENVDYEVRDSIHQNGGIKNTRGGDKKSKDYFTTLDMAKNLALVENNDNGFIVRKYFIVMEKALRNYETWTSIREPEKDGWNIMRQYVKEWCIRNNYDETLNKFYIREANMININLTGKSANEIKTHIGFNDTITRDHLDSETNKAISELQNINISLLLADLDFKTRSSIIKTTCENKYSELHIVNKIKQES
jgi:phage anti-repressor protein